LNTFQRKIACSESVFITVYVCATCKTQRIYIVKAKLPQALHLWDEENIPNIIRKIYYTIQGIEYVSSTGCILEFGCVSHGFST